MATPQPQKRVRKKRKLPKKFRLSYSLVLLFAMIVVGSVAGLVSYKFGKQALEGVNPSPAGIKLPKVSPVSKPKDSPKPSPQSPTNGKTSLLLDEAEVIAEIQSRSQQELGGLTRPAFVAKANVSDRKKILGEPTRPAFVAKANVSDRKRIDGKVDRAYNSMRAPLEVSNDADDRIAARIAALRQRVYSRSRSYDSNFDRLATTNSPSLSALSRSVELTPIRSRWEDRDAADLVVNPRKVTVQVIEIAPQPTNSFFIPPQQIPSAVEVNRR